MKASSIIALHGPHTIKDWHAHSNRHNGNVLLFPLQRRAEQSRVPGSCKWGFHENCLHFTFLCHGKRITASLYPDEDIIANKAVAWTAAAGRNCGSQDQCNVNKATTHCLMSSSRWSWSKPTDSPSCTLSCISFCFEEITTTMTIAKAGVSNLRPFVVCNTWISGPHLLPQGIVHAVHKLLFCSADWFFFL